MLSVRLVGLVVGLVGLGVGLVGLSVGLVGLSVGFVELGVGLAGSVGFLQSDVCLSLVCEPVMTIQKKLESDGPGPDLDNKETWFL